jgi:hypothetical protein
MAIVDLDADQFEYVVRATALLIDAEAQRGRWEGSDVLRRLLSDDGRGGRYVFVYPDQLPAVEAVLRGDPLPSYPMRARPSFSFDKESAE